MAVEIKLICDLDPTQNEDTQTVTFSDGTDTYTVDLSVYAREALAKALAPFVAVATKVEPKVDAEPSIAAQVREWAKKKGLEVSERGRVSKELTDQFLADQEADKNKATQGEADEVVKPARTRKTAAK